MIQVYPIEIEAVDADHNPVFKLRAFDEYSATLTTDTLIAPNTVDEFCAALSQAVALLALESPK